MLTKHLIRLWPGDMARLQEIYPTKGANAAIRDLVRAHLERVERRLQEQKELTDAN